MRKAFILSQLKLRNFRLNNIRIPLKDIKHQRFCHDSRFEDEFHIMFECKNHEPQRTRSTTQIAYV